MPGSGSAPQAVAVCISKVLNLSLKAMVLKE